MTKVVGEGERTVTKRKERKRGREKGSRGRKARETGKLLGRECVHIIHIP